MEKLLRWIVYLLSGCLFIISVQAQTTVGVIASGFLNQVKDVNITAPGVQAGTLGGITARPGFSVGGFIQADHTSLLSSRIEVNYTNAGFNVTLDDQQRSALLISRNTFHYAQFSPMVGARTKRGFSLFTGPTLNTYIGNTTYRRSAELGTQGALSITSQWLKQDKSYLESLGPSNGSVEPFVLGWQAQLGYTYKRFSIHARRQWHLRPMGNLGFGGSNSFLYFRSWQYGLTYTLFQSKGKVN